MASIETDFIIDGDEGYDPDSAPTVPVRVDGDVYIAHCPKDSVLLLLADLQGDISEVSQVRTIVEQLLLGMFDEDDAQALLGKIFDPSNRRVGMAYVISLLHKIVEHFEDELGMQVVGEQSRGQGERGTAKAPTRKAPAKKTTTRKSPANKKTAAAA
ncbi:hypothetical protein ACGFX7_06065 [Streptomyces harbinensis]|uniref:hypothetical protein n=1 Tax=Streptomyces harbinensis TaxID=1176198 RepID=UPI0037136EB6